MEKEQIKKKLVVTFSMIAILILVVAGISYAAFRFIGQGNKVNQITTGTIRMNYTEDANVIRLNNALPTTDATGKVRLTEGEYFDFSVTTNITGDAIINWEIAAEDFLDNTFDGSNVKFYLTKIVDGKETEVSANLPAVYNEQTSENTNTGRPANMMSLLTGTSSTQGEETINYRLRLYVTEEYNPQGDGGGLIFKTRINVYGKVNSDDELVTLPVMKSYSEYSTEDFHNSDYKDRITSIDIKRDIIIPETAVEVENGKKYWDVSESQDNNVIAYIENKGIEQDLYGNDIEAYKLTIGGNGGVAVNTNASSLFRGFTHLASINLTYLDTSLAEDMSHMFEGCRNLVTLDLSSFNTSKVTNMAHMFNLFDITMINKLESIDLSSFDTSNVTNMSDMFYFANLKSLDLSNFNTTKVTDMSRMFCECHYLTSLVLTNFDTTNVTGMQDMFSYCDKLTDLNISSFDTSKVTHMGSMFNSCNSLTSLNLTNFDTTNVTDMQNMFAYCKNLTNITVGAKWIVDNANTTNIFNECGTDHVTVV